VVCTDYRPNRRAFRDPHYHLPLINWLPTPLAEVVINLAGRSKRRGPCKTGKSIPRSTPTVAEFERVAAAKGFRVHDQVKDRIKRGEIRQLQGWKRTLLNALLKSRILDGLT